MEFETQRALLEYLGKNPNDRSLVQRMIIRGEVYKENGMYILVNRDEKIRELEFLVEKLRSEITTMKESGGDLEEAKAQWKYWENLYNEEYEAGERRLRKAFDWIKQRVKWVTWEEFHERVVEEEELPF